MSDPFIGEIRAFAANFVPADYWLPCSGQIYNIAQFQALYSLIGNTFGGDVNQRTFGIPNLNGNIAIGSGQGPGLSQRTWGTAVGEPSVTLSSSQMAVHNHALTAHATGSVANLTDQPSSSTWLSRTFGQSDFNSTSPPSPTQQGPGFDSRVIGATGGGPNGAAQAHSNQQPYLSLIFGIAFDGVYPVAD